MLSTLQDPCNICLQHVMAESLRSWVLQPLAALGEAPHHPRMLSLRGLPNTRSLCNQDQ